MKISIIIPTFNEEKFLPKLLESISRQTLKDYEVIVSDAGSNDKTKKIAKEYNCKIVKGGAPGPARNRGADVAKGEFLYFFDADVKLPKKFLEKTYEEIQEKFIDVATCKIVPLSNVLIDKVLHQFMNATVAMSQFTVPYGPGCCIIITKRLFNRINGFDESLVLAEDHDIVKRASRFRPLRVLGSSHVKISVRRLRKEGRLTLLRKYLAVEMHKMTKGQIRKDIINYKFADYSTKTKGDKLDSKLRLIEKQLNILNMEYNKIMKNHISIKEKNIAKLKNKFSKIRESISRVLR